MKRTFNFRYYQNKFGDWIAERQYLFFGFIPVWMDYKQFSRHDFTPCENREVYVLKFISDTIDYERKLMEHKVCYRTVNENSFKKNS
jgi:hypothetical protein